ncbi:hypothetical protein ACFL6G_01845 [candidate division KSB1 bacterium]
MAINTQKSVDDKNVFPETVYQGDVSNVYNICKACMGYDTCTFPIDLSRPTLHCAEFKPFPAHPGVSFSGSSPRELKASGKDSESKYTGLCRNCDLNNNCTFAQAGKPILNCDEYQ